MVTKNLTSFSSDTFQSLEAGAKLHSMLVSNIHTGDVTVTIQISTKQYAVVVIPTGVVFDAFQGNELGIRTENIRIKCNTSSGIEVFYTIS